MPHNKGHCGTTTLFPLPVSQSEPQAQLFLAFEAFLLTSPCTAGTAIATKPGAQESQHTGLSALFIITADADCHMVGGFPVDHSFLTTVTSHPTMVLLEHLYKKQVAFGILRIRVQISAQLRMCCVTWEKSLTFSEHQMPHLPGLTL